MEINHQPENRLKLIGGCLFGMGIEKLLNRYSKAMLVDSPWNPIPGLRKRVSSYDRSGGSRDYWTLEPAETRIIFAQQGSAGSVLRLWFTLNSKDIDYLKRTAISMVFDGEETVAGIPFGLFTGTGPWAVNDLRSFPVNVMRSRMANRDQAPPGLGSFNLAWRMPFKNDCVIRIHNLSSESLMLFFHVEYLLADAAPPPRDTFLFRATHRRQELTVPQGQAPSEPSGANDLPQGDAKNLSNAHNYVFTAIDGYTGNYVGTVLAVESHPDRCGKWYEGDDMFFVDGAAWPPALHGTGTEDYFGMAWGIHREYQAWDHGVAHYERNITNHDRFYDGRFVLYRWHLADPIPFRQSLHASLEAGHANDCQQCYESVAFWYGRKIS